MPISVRIRSKIRRRELKNVICLVSAGGKMKILAGHMRNMKFGARKNVELENVASHSAFNFNGTAGNRATARMPLLCTHIK